MVAEKCHYWAIYLRVTTYTFEVTAAVLITNILLI
jgi:hypothetical protein